jgi:hypothetical protein
MGVSTPEKISAFQINAKIPNLKEFFQNVGKQKSWFKLVIKGYSALKNICAVQKNCKDFKFEK